MHEFNTYERRHPQETNSNFSHLIGRNIETVQQELTRNHIVYRVVFKDGQSFIGTCDYLPHRINLSVNNGLVTSASNG